MSENEFEKCVSCGSTHIRKFGNVYSADGLRKTQRYQCMDCHKWMLSKKKTPVKPKTMKVGLGAFKYQEQPLPETNWSALTKAQNNEKTMLLDIAKEMLSELTIVQDPKKNGRKFSDVKDMAFCLIAKTYTGLSSRRLESDLRQAQANEQIAKVPHFTTLMNFLEKPELTELLHELIKLSALPVKELESQYAIDSSGFSSSQFGRWFDFKYGEEKIIRNWVKAHIMCGTRTNIITSVELTRAYGADSPRLQPLVEKTCKDFTVKEVSADKAYSSRKNFQIIKSNGAIPYIPFKSNARIKKKGLMIWRKCYEYFHEKPQEYLEHYHRRSNVETCFAMVKQKFGKDVITKNYVSQCNEVLLKILCHNICCLIQEYFENNIENYYSTNQQKISIPEF
ncbi:MAG: IS5 family transposase [Candidatus Diapherotrites archaeon]|nr:IS5 family transposase [Candidatus Diapherotrites archaeon]